MIAARCVAVTVALALGRAKLTGQSRAANKIPNAIGLAPHLGLLVPLGHDVLEGGAHHGALELLRPAGPLLGHILLQTLLVLPGEIWSSHMNTIHPWSLGPPRPRQEKVGYLR
jgi:hypothetical protein